MLYNLHVKNLAIIDEIEVTFDEGFNVLTGETGAGKSIIIDSINTVLGGRAQKNIIRDGEKEALIELMFTVETKAQEEKLMELGISAEDHEVLLTRKISEKRTINRINGESVAASKLREVAALFIDIHGQNEHETLTSAKNHREIIDDYASEKVRPLKEKIAQSYDNFKKLDEQAKEYNIPESERTREISFLEFELNEIENAKLKHGEEAKLEEDLKRLTNARSIGEALSTAYSFTEGMGGASEKIGAALQEVIRVKEFDKDLGGIADQLSELDVLVNDLNRDIDSYMSEFDIDEATLLKVSERLDLIKSLKQKYGNTSADVIAYGEEIREKLQKYKDYEKNLSEIHEKMDREKEVIKEYSLKLSDVRSKAAKEFDKKMTEALLDLNFPQVIFETRVEKSDRYTKEGCDSVVFYVSLNKGSEPRPLQEAASGGEMSRIMLAMKSVFASDDDIPTLIFDEIDTGISGRTAQKVAEKIVSISDTHQVICISHLAQIAAMADSHFLIEKNTDTDKTLTGIKQLKDSEKIQEIARILGGVSITDAVISSAEEMKKLADTYKSENR